MSFPCTPTAPPTKGSVSSQLFLDGIAQRCKPAGAGIDIFPAFARWTREADATRTYPAFYNTPHLEVPGRLMISPALIQFDPDLEHPSMRDVGAEQYGVHVDGGDITDCGTVAMPESELPGGNVAFWLQVHVKTLDGIQFLTTQESETDPWTVVFQLQSREELCEAAGLVLDSAERAKASDGGKSIGVGRTKTFVPFPCLEYVMASEAVEQRQHLNRQFANRTQGGSRPSPSDPDDDGSSRPVAVLKELGVIAADVWRYTVSVARGGQTFGNAAVTARPDESNSEPSPTLRKDNEPSPMHGKRVETVTLRPGALSSDDALLTRTLAECIHDYLPIRLRLPGAVEWVLRYTPKTHGVSLATLYRNMAGYEQSILLIRDVDEYLFGGYACGVWEPKGKFYGASESFVFSFADMFGTRAFQSEPVMQCFPWTSRNRCVMYGDMQLIAMGGGEGRHAVALRSDLLRGFSWPTATFGNPVLAGAEEFVARDFELWALEEVDQ